MNNRMVEEDEIFTTDVSFRIYSKGMPLCNPLKHMRKFLIESFLLLKKHEARNRTNWSS